VFAVRYEYHLHVDSKAIPLAGRGGLLACEILMIPYCVDNRLEDCGEFASLSYIWYVIVVPVCVSL
jgi:hypothetical protein